MAGIAAGLGKLAGKGVGVAAQGAAGVAGATTGFVGGMISPVLKFFNDVIKQRVAAADEATKKREARDDKIVEICEAIWKGPIATQTLRVNKEVAPAPAPAPTPNTSSGAPLQIENSPLRSEELALRNRDQ
jgi:hypothetical protein